MWWPSAAAPPPPPEAAAVQPFVAVLTALLGAVIIIAFSQSAILRKELALSKALVKDLQAQLATKQHSSPVPRATAGAMPGAIADIPDTKPIRIWMDGAFDMMHYGHVNAFRQGRSLGTHLVVGVNDDESITRCKGPPVMDNAERIAMVEGCKFVDEVVPNVCQQGIGPPASPRVASCFCVA